jgi:hypothetical protein
VRQFAIIVLAVVVLGAYGLNRGVYVGSDDVVMGAPCCPTDDQVQKRCHYLFVTGFSTIDARDGQVAVSQLLVDDESKLKQAGFSGDEISKWVDEEKRGGATKLLRHRRDLNNGYCRLFGD